MAKTKPHVIIAHNPKTTKLISDALTREGVGFTKVDSAKEVILAAGHRRGNIALMLSTPLPDGKDTLELIKRLRKARNTIIIMVFGHALSPETRVALLLAGADDCVTSSCEKDEFVARFGAIARGRRLGADDGARFVGEVASSLGQVDSDDPVLHM